MTEPNEDPHNDILQEANELRRKAAAAKNAADQSNGTPPSRSAAGLEDGTKDYNTTTKQLWEVRDGKWYQKPITEYLK